MHLTRRQKRCIIIVYLNITPRFNVATVRCVFRSDSNSIKIVIFSPFKMHTWLIQDKCFIVHSLAIQNLEVPSILAYLACMGMSSVSLFRACIVDACGRFNGFARYTREESNGGNIHFLVQFPFCVAKQRDVIVWIAYVLSVQSHIHTAHTHSERKRID